MMKCTFALFAKISLLRLDESTIADSVVVSFATNAVNRRYIFVIISSNFLVHLPFMSLQAGSHASWKSYK